MLHAGAAPGRLTRERTASPRNSVGRPSARRWRRTHDRRTEALPAPGAARSGPRTSGRAAARPPSPRPWRTSNPGSRAWSSRWRSSCAADLAGRGSVRPARGVRLRRPRGAGGAGARDDGGRLRRPAVHQGARGGLPPTGVPSRRAARRVQRADRGVRSAATPPAAEARGRRARPRSMSRSAPVLIPARDAAASWLSPARPRNDWIRGPTVPRSSSSPGPTCGSAVADAVSDRESPPSRSWPVRTGPMCPIEGTRARTPADVKWLTKLEASGRAYSIMTGWTLASSASPS